MAEWTGFLVVVIVFLSCAVLVLWASHIETEAYRRGYDNGKKDQAASDMSQYLKSLKK